MITEYVGVIVGKADKVSGKGNPYTSFTIMDNGYPVGVMSKLNPEQMKKVELYKEKTLVLDIRLGKYTNVDLVDIR